MQRQTRYGAIAQTHAGQGLITFPRGGRIKTACTLYEHEAGAYRLACEGQFSQASYTGWEQLVHEYRMESPATVARAHAGGQVERFAGRLDDGRELTVGRMVLIAAQASGVGQVDRPATLTMQFDCRDVRIAAPASPA